MEHLILLVLCWILFAIERLHGDPKPLTALGSGLLLFIVLEGFYWVVFPSVTKFLPGVATFFSG
jgi:hypothetical protein